MLLLRKAHVGTAVIEAATGEDKSGVAVSQTTSGSSSHRRQKKQQPCNHDLPPNVQGADNQLKVIVETLHQEVNQGGCPWTAATSTREMIGWLESECAEIREALDAVDDSSDDATKAHAADELGDMLFDALMVVAAAERDYGIGGTGEPWRRSVAKIRRRTPYMAAWGDGVSQATTAAEATEHWQAAKTREKSELHHHS
jgi:NTP pyrophosphatase (non-canonical NTP hydrolase)